ncbi:MAG: (2Fe-2S) ferredoxin domain-containing protein, partial [Bacilli bacterium]|nr:(2Fe-2S) ferredoxin domain-containing protein [Bacilli bacterium]
MISNKEQLLSIIDKEKINYQNKISNNNVKSIHICGGTGCLSADSLEIKAEFERLIKLNKIQDKVNVNIVG